MEKIRMTQREILDAQMSGRFIVKYPVAHCRCNGKQESLRFVRIPSIHIQKVGPRRSTGLSGDGAPKRVQIIGFPLNA
jgi:hypothetical protein